MGVTYIRSLDRCTVWAWFSTGAQNVHIGGELHYNLLLAIYEKTTHIHVHNLERPFFPFNRPCARVARYGRACCLWNCIFAPCISAVTDVQHIP